VAWFTFLQAIQGQWRKPELKALRKELRAKILYVRLQKDLSEIMAFL
jgi:hypothetical protein